MAIVFCHKERGISVEEENHLVTVGIVKKSKTILVLLASPNACDRKQHLDITIQLMTVDVWIRGI